MRKQDNSKLIYLLIGVVAVFILVFQYKSWCSAAEFEIVEKYSEEVEEAISSIPLEEVVVDDEGVSELISEAPILEATSETVVQNFDDSAIVDELKKSNEYWEMFLDSFEVPYSEVLPFTFSNNTTDKEIVFNSNFVLIDDYSSTYSSSFIVPVKSGTLSFSLGSTSSFPRCGLVTSLDVGTSAFYTFTLDSTSFVVDVPFDCYLVVSYISNTFNDDSSVIRAYRTLNLINNSYALKSYTLSELGNAVIQNGTNVSEILVYVLITCCFVCCFISLQIAWHTRLQIRKWSGRS